MNTSIDSVVLRSQLEIKESEEMAHYLDRRVTDIEKSFGSLTTEFIGYARRTAKLRNNGDKIADILTGYVSKQMFNSTTHECLKAFSNTMSIVEDLRNVELDRIRDHVIRPMIEYNGTMKDIKNEIKKDMAARKKELASYKKLDKTNKSGTVDEAKARASTHIAVLDATRQSEKLLITVSAFEKKKLEHLQAVLRSFIHIEMLWHMRALERYTEAYRCINGIDCEADLSEFLDDLKNFRSQDHLTRSNSNLNLIGRRSQSLTNLKSTNASSQGELRASVTFEDQHQPQQHQRSRSFQNQPSRDSYTGGGGGNTVVKASSQTDLSNNRGALKPPVANGNRPVMQPSQSDESDYTDSEDYTEDGTTTPSRTASARSTNRSGGNQPVPQKRVDNRR